MTNRLLDLQNVLRPIERQVQQAGGQSAWARRTGVNRTNLNKLPQGRRPPSPQFIKALGLKKVVTCASPGDNDLVPLLRRAVERAGSTSAWSPRTGTLISLVINGKRAPSSQFEVVPVV
jgi:DNA-binding transcriptional regulator YdaS (Cro superfamily)